MKSIKRFLILILILMFLLSLSTVVNAAGSYNASATSTSLTVGQSTNLTIKTTNAEGKFSITSSNPDVVSVGTASIWITGSDSITLTAKSAGTANIIIKPVSVSDTDLNLITNSQTVKITVKDTSKPSTPTTPSNNNSSSSNSNNNNQNSNNNNTAKKSSDASLKSITVGGNSYKIGDTVTVGADTSSIEIKATANSSKASVSGTGAKELVAGTNKFTIRVTAEDGSKKNYTVTVIREEYVDDTPNIEDPNYQNQTEELRLSTLVIKDLELTPQFSSEIFEYSTYLINEDEIEINATSNIEGTNIEIVGNTNLVEGENIVTIKLTKDDKTVEYKIIVNKSVVNDGEEQEEKKIGFVGWISDWWNNSGSTIVVFTIILVLLGAAAIFAVTSYKYSNNAKEVSKHTQSQTQSGYVEDIFSKQEK